MTEVSNKVLRKTMLKLMGYDNSWQNDPEKSSQIKAIGRCLYSDKIIDKKPLPRLDVDNYTRSDYEKHLSQGYLVNDIKNALGLGSHRFQEWRISVGLVSKKSKI